MLHQFALLLAHDECRAQTYAQNELRMSVQCPASTSMLQGKSVASVDVWLTPL